MFYDEIVKKTSSHLKLLDFLNNHFCVASKIILDFLNKALQERTNLIFAELIPNIKVIFIYMYNFNIKSLSILKIFK